MSTGTQAFSERDSLLLKWQNAQKELEKVKAVELELRNEVVAMCFPSHKDEGTENVELGNGYKLKAVFKQNYTLDKEKIDDALTAIESMGPEGQFISERLVKFEPKLQVREYKELDSRFKVIVDEALTIKPGTPSLEIVEPKTKK